MIAADSTSQQLIPLLTAFRSELITLWNIFFVVSLGLVGVVYGEKFRAPTRTKVALTVIFAIYALGNWASISNAQRFIIALRDRLVADANPTALATTYSQLHTSSLALVTKYHLLLSVAVLLAIWFRPKPVSTAAGEQPRPLPNMGDAPQMGLRSPEGWRGRLALADLRWVWAAVIAFVLFGAYVLLWPKYKQALEAVCRDQYARALTAADTQGVDGLLPLVQDPKFAKRSITCGTLRRAGKL